MKEDRHKVKVLSAKDLDELATISDPQALLRGLQLMNSLANNCRFNDLAEEKIIKMKDMELSNLDSLRKRIQMSGHDYARLQGLIMSVSSAFIANKSKRR